MKPLPCLALVKPLSCLILVGQVPVYSIKEIGSVSSSFFSRSSSSDVAESSMNSLMLVLSVVAAAAARHSLPSMVVAEFPGSNLLETPLASP